MEKPTGVSIFLLERKLILKNKAKHSEEELYNLMTDLVMYLYKNELLFDVNIYVNAKRYSTSEYNTDTNIKIGSAVMYQSDCENPEECVEYCNKDTLTMTFEGPLYQALNYDGTTEEDLNKIFAKYGLYYEQGYAWSLTAYDI